MPCDAAPVVIKAEMRLLDGAASSRGVHLREREVEQQQRGRRGRHQARPLDGGGIDARVAGVAHFPDAAALLGIQGQRPQREVVKAQRLQRAHGTVRPAGEQIPQAME